MAEQRNIPADLVEIGTLARPHGIRGEIRVNYYADSLELLRGDVVYLQAGNKPPRKMEIDTVRMHQGTPLIRFVDAVFLCAAGRQHHPYRFAPENDESGRRHFPAGLFRAGAAAHQACHRSSQDVDAGVCAGPQAEGPAAGAAAVVRRDARPDERAGKDPAEKWERLAGRPDQVPAVPLLSNAVPRGAVDQKLDEQDRFLKKEIDKTPKNGYILCINAMKKSVHRRQLSREPGQVKAGKCAGMRCRF